MLNITESKQAVKHRPSGSMEVTLGTTLSSLLLDRFTISLVPTVIIAEMGTEFGKARELEVAASARVDGSASVVRHVNAQLVEIDKRLVALGTRVLFLLVLLRHVQPACTAQALNLLPSPITTVPLNYRVPS